MSHTYESYQVNDFHNSSIFIKVQWAEWHAMHSLVNFNDFLFTKQNLYFQSFENIWKNLSKKYFFKMIFRICKTVMVFYQFSESISGEYYVENCNLTVTVGWILRTSYCKYSWLNPNIQPRTLNGIEKPQNPKDFFCNSNHRFSQISSWLIHDTTGAFTNVPGFLNPYTDKTHLTRLSLWIRYW